jgi:hypothetical protein
VNAEDEMWASRLVATVLLVIGFTMTGLPFLLALPVGAAITFLFVMLGRYDEGRWRRER